VQIAIKITGIVKAYFIENKHDNHIEKGKLMKTSKIASFLAKVVCPGALPLGMMTEAQENYSGNVNEHIQDRLISRNVTEALSKDIQFGYGHIQVETHHGIVHLNGGVDTSVQKRHAAEVAHAVYGVRKVRNKITVRDLLKQYLAHLFSGLHKTH
jgi:hyperosmotically inducible periplasmic protein